MYFNSKRDLCRCNFTDILQTNLSQDMQQLKSSLSRGVCFQSSPRGQVAYSIVCITSVSTFRGVKDQVQNISPRKNCLLILPKPAEKKKANRIPQLTSIFCLNFVFRLSFRYSFRGWTISTGNPLLLQLNSLSMFHCINIYPASINYKTFKA